MANADSNLARAFFEHLGRTGMIGTTVIGAFAGIAAKALMPRKGPAGLILTVLIGIGGAALGSYVSYRNMFPVGNSHGFTGAVVGAFLVLTVYRIIFLRGR